jgi:hypothetical protein
MVARSRSRSGGTHQSSVGTLRNTPGNLQRDCSRLNRPNLLVRTGAQFYAQTIRSSRRSPPSTAPASVWPRVQLQAGPGEAGSAAAPRCGLRCLARGSGLERGKPGSPGSPRPSSLLLAWCTPIGPLPWHACLPLLPNTRRRTAYTPFRISFPPSSSRLTPVPLSTVPLLDSRPRPGSQKAEIRIFRHSRHG